MVSTRLRHRVDELETSLLRRVLRREAKVLAADYGLDPNDVTGMAEQIVRDMKEMTEYEWHRRFAVEHGLDLDVHLAEVEQIRKELAGDGRTGTEGEEARESNRWTRNR